MTKTGPEIVLIAALSRDRQAIGRGGGLPWYIPADMRHFRELTMGRTVVMGRTTWESIPNRPLRGRRNMVLSRAFHGIPLQDRKTPDDGAEWFPSLEAVMAALGANEVVMVIGGAQIYRLFMPLACRMELTMVDAGVDDADAFFPEFNGNDWVITKKIKPEVNTVFGRAIEVEFLSMERRPALANAIPVLM